MYTTITYSKQDRVAVVTLNRATVANAISRLMTRELDLAFNQACIDDDIRCIVLRSEGSHFSSGHDLGSKEQMTDMARPQELDIRPRGTYLKWYANDVEAVLKWRRIRKPIVCGLKGYTIYHGTVLSACADICLAADDLKYMPSLVEANLFPWVANLHIQKVKEILFTQRFILAPEAKQMGIVNRVVPAEKLDEELMTLAKLISRSDQFYLWMSKKMINSAQDGLGMETHIRSSLDTWTSYRRDSQDLLVLPKDQKTIDHGGKLKKLAPVSVSLQGEAWRQSELGSELSSEMSTCSSELDSKL